MSELEIVEKELNPGNNILLFAREQNRDDCGLVMSYVLLCETSYVKLFNTKPMSIKMSRDKPIIYGAGNLMTIKL